MTGNRRTILSGSLLAILLWATLIGTVLAQEPGRDPGAMPQNALFRATLLFAQALPFVIGLGILIGLYRLRIDPEKSSSNAADGTVRRHSWTDVGLHWLNALGFLLCLSTAAMLLRWVNRILDLQLIYVFHYVGSIFIAYVLVSFVTHSLVGGYLGLWPKLRDIPDALGELVGYLGIFGESGVFGIRLPRKISVPIARLCVTFGLRKPQEAGKYLATEKVLSFPIWSILASLILFSGLVKTLRYTWPIPTGVVGLATWVHDLTSIAIVVWLVVHVASTTLIPRNWPLFKSMFTTKVPQDYVKTHHPAWYRQLRPKELLFRSSGQKEALKPVSQAGRTR